jgi:hypothetical protein
MTDIEIQNAASIGGLPPAPTLGLTIHEDGVGQVFNNKVYVRLICLVCGKSEGQDACKITCECGGPVPFVKGDERKPISEQKQDVDAQVKYLQNNPVARAAKLGALRSKI